MEPQREKSWVERLPNDVLREWTRFLKGTRVDVKIEWHSRGCSTLLLNLEIEFQDGGGDEQANLYMRENIVKRENLTEFLDGTSTSLFRLANSACDCVMYTYGKSICVDGYMYLTSFTTQLLLEKLRAALAALPDPAETTQRLPLVPNHIDP